MIPVFLARPVSFSRWHAVLVPVKPLSTIDVTLIPLPVARFA